MALARWTGVVQDGQGNAVSGATVEVRREEGGGLAVLFSDREGEISLGNPFTSTGPTVWFHADGGSYRIKATIGSFEQEWRYVSIGTAAELDADALNFQTLVPEDAGKTVVVNDVGNGYRYSPGLPTPTLAAAGRPVVANPAGDGFVFGQEGPFVYLESFGAQGNNVANDTAALNAALTALSAAGGGTVLLKANKTYLINSGITVPARCHIIGHRFSSRLRLANQTSTGLILKGSNMLKDFDIIGTGIGDGNNGVALISIAGTSASDIITNVLIDGVRGREALGDGVRISDSQFIWILNTDWRVSRNPVTINDDFVGTAWVWVDKIYGAGKVIGFACESDDDLYVVQNVWLTNFHFACSPGFTQSGATYAVGFTKAAASQSNFAKHRNIHILDGKVEGFFYACVVRGGDGVQIRGLVSKSCTRGIEIGLMNKVRMCSISDCKIEATNNLLVVYDQCEYITAHDNFCVGSSANIGLYIVGCTRVQVHNNTMIGTTGSNALRCTSSTGIFAHNTANTGGITIDADSSAFKAAGLNFIG